MERVCRLKQHLTNGSVVQYVLPEGAGILSSTQIKSYEENGYIVIKGVFTASELNAYRNRFSEICNGARRDPGMLVMKDVLLARDGSEQVRINSPDGNVTKIQNIQDDEVLFSFCKHPKLLKYVRAFCGDSIRSIHTMLINKPPDLGKGTSRHPMHQDLYYFPLAPAERIVGAWVAIDKVTRNNGCLAVIPGSHKKVRTRFEFPLYIVNNVF
mmetsp:Transcript_13028/g.28075  ORF Transcript_13028/g.28075 Transcript_13028/m.28075 type:complete len:212 (+) Transcript_13028:324-959(+)